MIFKNVCDLTIINTDKKETSIGVSFLKSMLLKPNYYVYFSYLNKIYGVVSIDKIFYAYENGAEMIDIQFDFGFIEECNIILAKEFFRNNINELPVIINGNIVGAYFNGVNFNCIKSLYSYDGYKIFNSDEFIHKVCFVYSSSIDYDKINFLKDFFVNFNCVFRFISFENFLKIDTFDSEYYLFESDAELKNGDYIMKMNGKYFFDMLCFSLSSFYKRFEDTFISYLSQKYLSLFFNDLNSKGINVFNIYFEQNEDFFKYKSLIDNKYFDKGLLVNPEILDPEKFFLDYYSIDYCRGIRRARKILNENLKNISGVNYLMDCEDEFINIKDGVRRTCYQIENPNSLIHMYGPCLCIGSYVEDKHTIESFFQKRLNEEKNRMNVVNHGALNNTLSYMEMIRNTKLYAGDTVVFFMLYYDIFGINNLNLNNVLFNSSFPVEYFVDSVYHGNFLVNKVYSDNIYDYVVPRINNDVERVEINDIKNYSVDVYIDRYFNNYDFFKFDRVGSIVMNCNPFTYGHQYLIEKASSMVDFLIVFVLSEDLSMFNFFERFSMVLENTKNLSNVLVVPSGHMILSQKTFPEYFEKQVDSDIESNIRHDLEIFSTEIAPRLNIKYRFCGEELNDDVTNRYNLLMREILPKYGIEFVEIPRVKFNNDVISASLVRKKIKNNELDNLDNYISSISKKIIFDD